MSNLNITLTVPVWPEPNALASFFGRIELGPDGCPTDRWESTHLTQITLPYPMRLAWETEAVVRRITCHREVAASLSRVFTKILAHYGGSPEAVRAAGMDLYGGCYNYRPVRGSNSLSLHAYGAAIDLDPDHNAMNTKGGKGVMPQAVIDLFKAEGWAWGGDFKSRQDPMHFEAVRR